MKDADLQSEIVSTSRWVRTILPHKLKSVVACKCKDRIKKKVQFKDKALVEVFEFEESTNCRKKFWEFYVLDRFRFKPGIQLAEQTVGPILSPGHRQQILFKRFP